MAELCRLLDAPEYCPHVEGVAKQAVKEVFSILGVDVDRPESVEEFREDLRFGRKMRKAADHGFLAVIGILAVAAAAALWTGIVSKVTGGH